MIYVFYILAALLTYLSWKSLRGGLDYLNFVRRELAAPPTDFRPFATVFAPCRGLDEGLEENLAALFRQNYPRYELIFVIDDEADAAAAVIDRLIERAGAAFPHVAARRVVAGPAAGESQKVHNLRAAVEHAAAESEAFVFVDSDARPNPEWLGALVAPLADAATGAATGYRWFAPKKFGFAAELRSVWNASIASALGANTAANFCWGGSMALRRDLFERIGMRERWRGTLSDDFAVTRALRAENLPIRFVPRALAVSDDGCTLGECVEFTTRQMKITRVYAPPLWKLSFIGAGLFNLVWVWGALNLFLYPANSAAFGVSAAALALNAAFGVGKAHLRLRAVRRALGDGERAPKLRGWTQNTLWALTPALFFYNCAAALFSREIVWRGIRYRLASPSKTEIRPR